MATARSQNLAVLLIVRRAEVFEERYTPPFSQYLATQ